MKLCVPVAVVLAIVSKPLVLLMVTPDGCPDKLKVIGVSPVASTWNVPPVCGTVVLFDEVIVGAVAGAAFTVSVKFCIALGLTLLLAVIVKLCVPAAVVLAIVSKPLVLLMVTPDGCPDKLKAIGVSPVAVTWNVPPVCGTVVLFGEVIVGAVAGAAFTVNVKFCVELGFTLLLAVIVKL